MTRTGGTATTSQEVRRHHLTAPQVDPIAEQSRTVDLNNGARPLANQAFANVAMLDARRLFSSPTDGAAPTYDNMTGRSLGRAPATVREQWIAAAS